MILWMEPVVEDERAAAVGFKLKGLLIGGDNILDNERDGDAYTLFALLPSTLSVNMDYSIGDKSVLDDIDVVIDGEAVSIRRGDLHFLEILMSLVLFIVESKF